MIGTYFANPDCLEYDTGSEPYCRTRAQLVKAAESLSTMGTLVLTKQEADMIGREIGLAYKWHGRRIYVR